MSLRQEHHILTREYWILTTMLYVTFSFLIGGVCGLATGWLVFSWL